MNYTIIKNDDLRSENLKPTTKIVLLVLKSYHNKQKGYSYPSQATLMKDCCIKDKKTLLNALDLLEKEGYIKRVCGKGVNNKYFISGMENSTSVENHSSVENPHEGSVEKTTTSSRKKPHTRNTNTNTKYKDLNFIDLHLVKVTDEQYDKLVKVASGNTKLLHDKMLSLETGIANRQKKYLNYKNHYLTLRNWINKEKTPTAIGANKNNYNSSICKRPRVIPVSNEIDLFAN